MAKRKRLRRFLVGYPQRGQTTVWGRRAFVPNNHETYRIEDYCDLMTKTEAQRALCEFTEKGCVIFEPVPVEDEK